MFLTRLFAFITLLVGVAVILIGLGWYSAATDSTNQILGAICGLAGLTIAVNAIVLDTITAAINSARKQIIGQ
jgi:hypothetical protein